MTNEMTTEIALHCMKSAICEEVCEECPMYGEVGTDHCEDDAHRLAIQALEEIQQYRAIGTIEEFKALKEKNEPKKILYRKQSYGTPWLCPYCEADQIKVEFFSEDGSEPKEKYTFCWQCGTRIDWSE